MKLVYQKKLLRRVISLMDDAASATEICKAVNAFDAIMWLKCAWDAVSNVTIQKCFSKFGFPVTPGTLSGNRGENDETESTDEELGSLLSGIDIGWDKNAECDNELPTCETIEDDWEVNLIADLRKEEQDEEDGDLEDEDDKEQASDDNGTLTSYLFVETPAGRSSTQADHRGGDRRGKVKARLPKAWWTTLGPGPGYHKFNPNRNGCHGDRSIREPVLTLSHTGRSPVETLTNQGRAGRDAARNQRPTPSASVKESTSQRPRANWIQRSQPIISKRARVPPVGVGEHSARISHTSAVNAG